MTNVHEPQARASILVVDDDARMRQAIQWTLEDEGFVVDTAGDGRQALACMARHTPALVVLDMGLPDIDGATLAGRLRRAAAIAVPILLVTADGHAAEKARRVGAFAYLHKPFDIAALVASVQQGLKPA
jgi:DNA-binding response OmpR family regulator